MMERLICVVIGYVFGLFQTSYIIGKMHRTDIRRHGSGNAGTTNAFRTFGKKAGALTLFGDCFKCVAAMFVARALFQSSCGEILPLLSLYAAGGCILGHNFPFYLGFKGGKGIAASVGMVAAFDWKIFLICAVLFLGLFFIFHYVSLCSVLSYPAAFGCMVFFGQMGRFGMDRQHTLELYAVMGVLTLLALYRHRSNIKRLLDGTESRIFLSRSGKF